MNGEKKIHYIQIGKQKRRTRQSEIDPTAKLYLQNYSTKVLCFLPADKSRVSLNL